MRRALITILAVLVVIIGAADALPRLMHASNVSKLLAKRLHQATGYTIEIRGDAAFEVLPSPSFRAADLHVASASGTGDELLTTDGIRVSVSLPKLLLGRVDIVGITLIHPVLTLSVAPDGASNWARRAAGTGHLAPAVPFRQVDIIDGTLTYRLPSFAATLNHIEATAIRAAPREIDTALDADFNGEKLHLDLYAPLDCGSGGLVKLRAFVRAGGPRLGFDGTPSCVDGAIAGATGKLTGSTGSLRRAFTPLAETTASVLPDIPAALDGSLAVAGHRLVLDHMGVDVGQNHGSGKLTLTPGPVLQADLALKFDQLDLDRRKPTPATEGEVAALAVPAGGSVWSDRKLLPAGPAALDLKLSLDADTMRWRGLHVEQASLGASVMAGKVSIDRFHGTLATGTLDASGWFDGQHAQLALGLDAVKLPESMQPTSGTLWASATVTASGDSPAALVQSLNGHAVLKLTDGVLAGLDLRGIDRGLADFHRPADLVELVAATAEGGSTNFSSVEGTVTIDQGRVRTSDLRLVADGGTVKATLDADLARWRLSGRVELWLEPAIDGPPLALDLDGDLDDPMRRVDEKQLARLLAHVGSKTAPGNPAGAHAPAPGTPATNSPSSP